MDEWMGRRMDGWNILPVSKLSAPCSFSCCHSLIDVNSREQLSTARALNEIPVQYVFKRAEHREIIRVND